MHKVTKESLERLVGIDVEKMAIGFLPDDIHISLLTNTTHFNLRRFVLGKSTWLEPLLDFMGQPAPSGMREVNLTIYLQENNKSVIVGSFVDPDTRHVYAMPAVDLTFDKLVQAGTESEDFQAKITEIRSYYTDPLLEPSNNTKKSKLPFNPSIQHLGVLLDAGRSYFPLPWLRNMIDVLEQLNFNLVHFRLTDDQAFNILLHSHPELAQAAWNAPTNTTVYTPDELRQLVTYASDRGIILMPEINIPGHAGGWAGRTPGLVVPCAPFVCSHGYGLPLNISYPRIYDILKDILKEVISIFSTSPYIHLGGDEVEMAKPCFDDVEQVMMDYNIFEVRLAGILEALRIPQTRVVRWEMTGQKDVRNRVGMIPHYWFSTNYMGEPESYVKKGERAKDKLKRELDNNPNLTKIAPLFVSQGLYFDTNTQESGWHVYENTKRLVVDPIYEPLAVIAGTFELDPDFWLDRNVMGRLVAVAMGASNMTYTRKNFAKYYYYYCRLIDLPESICRRYGIPIMPEILYKATWQDVTTSWRNKLCDRLTYSAVIPEIVKNYGRVADVSMKGAFRFWNQFGLDPPPRIAVESTITEGTAFPHTRVNYTGIIIDLVRDGSYSTGRMERLKDIIDIMAKLGMNMLQLRLLNEYGFAFGVSTQFYTSTLAWNIVGKDFYEPYNEKVLRDLVAYAFRRGIEIVPEISLSTRSGGWFETDMLTPCAVTLCKQGYGVTTDVSNPLFMSAVFTTISELRSIFRTTEYIHLGYDERKEGQRCYDEANVSPNLGRFEQKLKFLLNHMKIPLDKVVRWENNEGLVYEGRAGQITHYRGDNHNQSIPSSHFTSTKLVMEDPDSDLKDAWDLYQHTRKLKKGKPRAILAWVGSMFNANWEFTNTMGRLVAVAMGASDETYTDEETFTESYFTACEEFKDKAVCSDFGKVWQPDKARSVLRYEHQVRLAASCAIRTTQLVKILPSPGFALNDIHDEL